METRQSSSNKEVGARRAAAACIGPNAVLQTLRALRELEIPDATRRIVDQAYIPDPLPHGMIPEAWFVRLVGALRDTLPPARVEAVLRRSGRYTAEYVGAHRIPLAFRGVLAVLPARAAIPLLLGAFRRHAWTFAGGGRFDVTGPFPGTLVLAGCPTCRDRARPAVAGCGAYYEAAFEGLLALAAPRARVVETACMATGAPSCRFQISLHPLAESSPGDPPCASS